jgi:hypothetical protein
MDDRAAFVPVTIAKKIAAVQLRAQRLGWPRELLLNSNLDDYGRPLGLAATLDPSDVIVAVGLKSAKTAPAPSVAT